MAARRAIVSRNCSSSPMLVGLPLLTTRNDSKSIQVTFRRFLVDFNFRHFGDMQQSLQDFRSLLQ